MKNLMFSLAFLLIGTVSFANTKEVKNVVLTPSAISTTVVKPAVVKVYCDGVYVGTITCEGCTTQQLINAATAMCA